MSDIPVAVLMVIGAFFMLVGALGVVRMPDLFTRMSATTKASTLGASALLVATAVYFNDSGITSRIVAIIAFMVITVPVAAHMLGRAAYISNVPLWEGTIRDELRGRYDIEGRILKDPDRNHDSGSSGGGES